MKFEVHDGLSTEIYHNDEVFDSAEYLKGLNDRGERLSKFNNQALGRETGAEKLSDGSSVDLLALSESMESESSSGSMLEGSQEFFNLESPDVETEELRKKSIAGLLWGLPSFCLYM